MNPDKEQVERAVWFERNEGDRLEELRNGDEPCGEIVQLVPLQAFRDLERWCAEQANGEADISSDLSEPDASRVRARASGFRSAQRQVALVISHLTQPVPEAAS